MIVGLLGPTESDRLGEWCNGNTAVSKAARSGFKSLLTRFEMPG